MTKQQQRALLNAAVYDRLAHLVEYRLAPHMPNIALGPSPDLQECKRVWAVECRKLARQLRRETKELRRVHNPRGAVYLAVYG